MLGVSEHQAAGSLRTRRRKLVGLAAALPSSSLDSQHTVYDVGARKAAVADRTNKTPTSAQGSISRVSTRQQQQHHQAAAGHGPKQQQQLSQMAVCRSQEPRQRVTRYSIQQNAVHIKRQQTDCKQQMGQRKRQFGEIDGRQLSSVAQATSAAQNTNRCIRQRPEQVNQQQAAVANDNTTHKQHTSRLLYKQQAVNNQVSTSSLHQPAEHQQLDATASISRTRRIRNKSTGRSKDVQDGASPRVYGASEEQQALSSLPAAQIEPSCIPQTTADAAVSPNFEAAAALTDRHAAAADADSDTGVDALPPTCLKARFNRLTAEQQLSILIELERLTELEEQHRARLAARRAAAEVKEKQREAVRGLERRSARHRKVLQWEGEGFSSRTGTPDPAGAATAPAPAADDGSAAGCDAVQRMRTRQSVAACAAVSSPACYTSRKRAMLAHNSLYNRSSPDPDMKDPAAAHDADDHPILHIEQDVPDLQDVAAAAAVHDSVDEDYVVDERPAVVRRLGVRAQARKSSRRCHSELLEREEDEEEADGFIRSEPWRAHLQ